MPFLQASWFAEEHRSYFPGQTACLSCLLESGRYQELLDLVKRDPPRLWHTQRSGVKALVALGRPKEALGYANRLLGSYVSGSIIDRESEAILLSIGNRQEAYSRYDRTEQRGRSQCPHLVPERSPPAFTPVTGLVLISISNTVVRTGCCCILCTKTHTAIGKHKRFGFAERASQGCLRRSNAIDLPHEILPHEILDENSPLCFREYMLTVALTTSLVKAPAYRLRLHGTVPRLKWNPWP